MLSTVANNSTMNMPWPNQKKLLEEQLQKGKESATLLQTLLQKPLDNHGSVSAAELAVQILRSFTDSISVLGPNEICQILAADGETKDYSSDRSSKATTGQRRKPGVKDRRGSYRRRNVSDTWIKFSSNMEDEYAWRKYGQKQILNSNFPRFYFRCTHKNDQGCKATKQVQRIKQDPPVLQTTYFGRHTCKKDLLVRAPRIIHETGPMDSCILSFEKNPLPSKQKVSVVMKEDTHSDVSDNHSLLDDVSDNNSLLDSTLWQDMVASEAGSTHLDEAVSRVYSSSSNTFQDLDIEAFSELADLDKHNLYDFKESDFFRTNY